MLWLLLYFPGLLKLLEGRDCTLFFSVHPKVTSMVSYGFLPQSCCTKKKDKEEEDERGRKRGGSRKGKEEKAKGGPCTSSYTQLGQK